MLQKNPHIVFFCITKVQFTIQFKIQFDVKKSEAIVQSNKIIFQM